MKKFLLSLAATLACASMSGKQVLTEVSFSGIGDGGAVTAWSWCQSNAISSGEWQYADEAHSDSTWVTYYDYTDASAYSYIVVSFNQTTTSAHFIVYKSDWNTNKMVDFAGGATYVAMPTDSLGDWANDVTSLVLQPFNNGILDVKEISYMTAEEFATFKAAEDDKEKSVVKTEDWTVEMTDTDGSGWNQMWYGETDLDALYKTVVIELESVSAPARVCVQSWDGANGTIYEFMLAASSEPSVVAIALKDMAAPGVGQVAITNRNVETFLIDSVSGVLKQKTGACTVKVSKIYYTSKEVESAFTEATEVKGYELKATEAGTVADGTVWTCASLDGFKATLYGSNLSAEASTSTFGLSSDSTIASSTSTYDYYLKTGAKSSADNKITISVPADGVVAISARSGSNQAYDRTIVLTQNGTELLNELAVDGLAVEADGETAYPIYSCRVAKGDVELTYPVGAMNIYAITFGTDYYVAAEATEEPEDEPDPEPTPTPATGDEITVWEGEISSAGWSGAGMLSDGGSELTAAGMEVGDVVRFYITYDTKDTLNMKIIEGHWAKMADFATAYSTSTVVEYVDVVITQDIYDAITVTQWWGNTFILQAGSNVTCTKITLIKASAEGIENVAASTKEQTATYNLAGQRIAAGSKGLMVRNGKVVLVK